MCEMRTQRELRCHACGCELTGGLDTYRSVGQEMCEECETALLSESEPRICRGGQWQRLSNEAAQQDRLDLKAWHEALQGLVGKTLYPVKPEDENDIA